MITKFINANIISLNDNNDIIQNGEIVVCDNLIKYVGRNSYIDGVDKIIDLQGDYVLPAFINIYSHPYFLDKSDIILDNYKTSSQLIDDIIIENDLRQSECDLSEFEKELINNGCLNNVILDENLDYNIIIDGLKDYDFIHLCSEIEANKNLKKYIYLKNIYLMNDEHFTIVNNLAKKYNLLVITHIAETLKEAGTCDMQTGMSPIVFLENYGVFDRKCLLLGCNTIEKDEIQTIAQYPDVSIGICLSEDLLLGNQLPQVQTMLKNNIKIGLGFNNLGANNLDMFREMYCVQSMQNIILAKENGLDCIECLKMCTRNSAEILGLNSGSLQENKDADFIVIDKNIINDSSNTYFYLINFANSSKINMIVKNGEIIKSTR